MSFLDAKILFPGLFFIFSSPFCSFMLVWFGYGSLYKHIRITLERKLCFPDSMGKATHIIIDCWMFNELKSSPVDVTNVMPKK